MGKVRFSSRGQAQARRTIPAIVLVGIAAWTAATAWGAASGTSTEVSAVPAFPAPGPMGVGALLPLRINEGVTTSKDAGPRLVARADQEDNQKLVEILDRPGGDTRGETQLMKDAIQASDISLTGNGTVGQHQFAQQFKRILANSMAVSRAIASKDPKHRADGATAALQLKGRQLDVVAQAVASLRAKDDADSKNLLDTLYALAATRSRLSFDEVEGDELAARTKRLKELERSRDRLQLKLIQAGEKLQGSSDTPLTLAQVQEHLGDRDVLIEWARVNPFDTNYIVNQGKGRAWGDPRYVAFVIVRDQAPEVVDLGPASVIEPVVMRLLDQLRKPAGVFDPAEARVLFDLVVKPWLTLMTGMRKQVDQLLLAPDGALNAIPFAALVDEEGRYLGERHALNYLTSGRDLIRLNAPSTVAAKSGERIVVIAAPDYGSADSARDSAKKLATKRQNRDIAEVMAIARENNQLAPELTEAQAKKLERLKQLSADKKAGKDVDVAEAKQIVSDLQAPISAGLFKSLADKLQKVEKMLDRQSAEADADAVINTDAQRRGGRTDAQPPSMAPEVTVRGRNPGSPGATREGRPGSVRQPASTSDSGSAKVKRRLLTFATLPGALAEGELLVQIAGLNPTQLFSGKEATERFVKNLHGPRILHIATHGFFLPPPTEAERSTPVARETGRRQVETDEPFGIRLGVQRNPMLRSGIALAGANQGSGGDDEDGILTAEELAQLDLQGTELVVLSACETGTGDVANGEGVFGLRRALMLAGARSQLVSLWRISDQGTSQLMGEYYRALLRGMSRSRALQVAQEKLRTSVATSHPYYWSAFVPAGDWRPIGGL